MRGREPFETRDIEIRGFNQINFCAKLLKQNKAYYFSERKKQLKLVLGAL